MRRRGSCPLCEMPCSLNDLRFEVQLLLEYLENDVGTFEVETSEANSFWPLSFRPRASATYGRCLRLLAV